MSIETNKAQRYILDAIPHLDAIWRTATWMTLSESDAEQLTENVFKKAYRDREISSVSPDIRISLFQILIKVCPIKHDRNKLGALTGTTESDYISDHAELLPHVGILPPEDITGAIRKLPLEIRTVMVLSTIERFSYSEIAQIIGHSMAAVSRMKQIGYAMLHRQLSQSYETAPNNANFLKDNEQEFGRRELD